MLWQNVILYSSGDAFDRCRRPTRAFLAAVVEVEPSLRSNDASHKANRFCGVNEVLDQGFGSALACRPGGTAKPFRISSVLSMVLALAKVPWAVALGKIEHKGPCSICRNLSPWTFETNTAQRKPLSRGTHLPIPRSKQATRGCCPPVLNGWAKRLFRELQARIVRVAVLQAESQFV
jgi:hypothetical protein